MNKEEGREVTKAAMRTLGPRLLNKLRKSIPDRDMEDVAQDIWMHFFRSMSYYRGECAPSTWLFRIAANRVADYWRSEYKIKDKVLHLDDLREVLFSEPLPRNGETKTKRYPRIRRIMSEGSDVYTERTEFLDMISALPVSYRQAVTLRLYYNLTFREIAQSLGISYEAARSRYRRAIARLRRK